MTAVSSFPFAATDASRPELRASLRVPARSVFVAGTDTGVGKTLISVALLHALSAHHHRVVGMKPVAAGARLQEGRLVSDDVLALRAASTWPVPERFDNPVLLGEPVSPHLAASIEGRSIRVRDLDRAHRSLSVLADAVVVEGAGGWRVPLNDTETLADLARVIRAPVLLVVGLRLGALNHALLTAEAIRADGLELCGWVANIIDADMRRIELNVDTLRRRLHAPLLAVVPWMKQPDARLVRLDLPQCLL